MSITLFALLLTAIFILFGSSLTESGGLLRQARALALVDEGLRAARVMSEDDWDLFSQGQHGLNFASDRWQFSGDTDVTDSTFFRSVTITDIDASVKEVLVDVYWNYWGRLLDQSAVTRVTNWKNVEVWGNWGNPIIVGSLDIGPQGQATSVIQSGNYAFLTAEVSSGNRPSLFSIDITDPTFPQIVDTYTSQDSLLSLVLVADTYLYVVGDESDLLLFDVSDPTNMQLLATYPISADGSSIMVDGSTLYIGTQNGVMLYDVTNPVSPTLLSTYTTSEEITGLAVSDTYLYAATQDSNQEVLILSVADPQNPVFVGSYNLPDAVAASAVHADGTKLYVGRENNSSTKPELYQFDRTNPTSLVLKNQIDLGGGVRGIATAGSYVYVATESSNLEFQIWQTGANWVFAYTTGINMAQVTTGLTFDNNTIFISLRSNDAFQIIQPSP